MLCHSQVVNADRKIIDASLHIDGVVEVTSQACNGGCHGSPDSPAPPPDLEGNTSTTSPGVGAHRSHLEEPHGLRGPIPCSTCHVVPETPWSPGHLDDERPADVFPATLADTSLAFADGSSPSYEPALMRCTGVYCHGNGAKLADDASPTLMRSPHWTEVGAGQAACGNCHGIPPVNSIHASVTGLDQCSGCHPQTVHAFGNIIITGTGASRTSTHMDGVVEVGLAP